VGTGSGTASDPVQIFDRHVTVGLNTEYDIGRVDTQGEQNEHHRKNPNDWAAPRPKLR
jgi:hypothetical protein